MKSACRFVLFEFPCHPALVGSQEKKTRIRMIIKKIEKIGNLREGEAAVDSDSTLS